MKLKNAIADRLSRRRKLPEPAALFQDMAQWLETPLGQALLESERKVMEPVLARIFGYHFLQIGVSEASLLDESPVGHRFLFVPQSLADSRHAVASAEALPLQTDSVDAVLIHHALDYTPDSHRLLREASRVLIPGGKLLIVGFNPLSTWGVRRLTRIGAGLPWSARFISAFRVCDWLKLLEFSVERVSHCAFLLPFTHPRVVQLAPALERVGKRLEAPVGAAYMIVACKQLMPVTPIMPRWPRISRPLIARTLGETARARPQAAEPDVQH
jgi:SAM-dependent methyltransferase